jgi:NAD(P)-dependent dehydrogenase (short-subunit alcohol dehydrogenase family)
MTQQEPTQGAPLAGRTVLVTGGNRGIGLAIGLGVARAGARVVLWGRDEAANAAAAAQIEAAGGQVLALRCDVSDEAQVQETFARTLAEVGTVDSVFANAGVNGRTAPFLEQTTQDWRQVLGVNLDGVIFTLRAALAHLVERGEGGSLVAVGSVASRVVVRNHSPYTVSKAAVVGLMRSLAVEYARYGVRANALLPGWVDTEMTSGASDAFRDQVVRRTPVRRFGTPDDFTRVAVFLADPTLTFHTGDSVLVDGGYLAV